MKRILYTICIGSVALALTAQGAPNNDQLNAPRKARKAPTVQQGTTGGAAVTNSSQMNTRRNVTNARFRQRTVTPQTTSNAVVRENNLRTNRVRTLRDRSDLSVNRERNLRVNRERNVAVNRERNLTVNRSRNVAINRDRNVNRNVTINRNVNRIG